jgi:hypothetical protein
VELDLFKKSLCRPAFCFLLLIFSLAAISLHCAGQETGTLQGLVTDLDNKSLPQSRITVTALEMILAWTTETDTRGHFQLSGLPPGNYAASFEAPGFKSCRLERVPIGAASSLFLQIRMARENSSSFSQVKPLVIEVSGNITRTTLSQSQIEAMPSGHNIWSLVENQDLSATTNRIDVGGMWSSLPALFSSRGGCSWTQNAYHLNGLNVTDPFMTGIPLFYPDFSSLQSTELITAGHPPQAFLPGAYFDLTTKNGLPRLGGRVSAFYIDKLLRSSNITSALREEGIMESHSLGRLNDFNAQLYGPLFKKKTLFFTSWTYQGIFRDLAEFPQEDQSSVFSGLMSMKFALGRSSLRALWTGQIINHSSFQAGRGIDFATTLRRKDLYNVFQLTWDAAPSARQAFRVGLSYAEGRVESNFQKTATTPHQLDIFKNIPSGTAASAGRDERSLLVLSLGGMTSLSHFLGARHQLQYGLEFESSASFSRVQILDNIHLHFFNGEPLEVVKYNTPLHHREYAYHFNVFFQDSLTISRFFTFYGGLHLGASQAGIISRKQGSTPFEATYDYPREKNEIRWVNLSPRLGIILPLNKNYASVIKVSGARYYFSLPLYYLTYGNPGSLGGQVYAWNDSNHDQLYQPGEAGALLRREGPFYAKIDSSLQRPRADELCLSFYRDLGSNWLFSLSGFLRESRGFVETVNIGVPSSEFEPVEIWESGDDQIPGNHDDIILNVWNQKEESLGKDFFLLTNPEGGKKASRYQGLDLTLVKKYSSSFLFFLSLTATKAIGTTSPGNTEWENDDGLVGALYDNPNTLINAKGRVRFDRAYTGRIGVSVLLPLGFRTSGILKYYDGQPFTRMVLITGFRQGPFFVQAFPRGVARYEYNLTMDLRLEKRFRWKNSEIRLIVDGFNVLNGNLATAESEWTSPEFILRFPTDIQSPRIFRLGLAYEF